MNINIFKIHCDMNALEIFKTLNWHMLVLLIN